MSCFHQLIDAHCHGQSENYRYEAEAKLDVQLLWTVLVEKSQVTSWDPMFLIDDSSSLVITSSLGDDRQL